MWWIIVAIIWLIGIVLSYKLFISKWDNSKFEKVWFSIVWPCLIPLYFIHWLYNKD